MNSPRKIYVASTNQGKLWEYRALAQDAKAEVSLELLPGIEGMPAFEEVAPTFGENAVGKALYYSRLSDVPILADDSGLVVTSLGGAPGVKSARYAGDNATNGERIEKLLRELNGKKGPERAAHFVCVIALARYGRAGTIVSERVDGCILESTYGESGFGYDPVFFFPHLKKTFAELSTEEKNKYSHRGKAFRRLLAALPEVL
ncbi:MAG TPA: RdgB/HAM1 family non-canonical purine NTP pyrophosphatase [Terriglobales bacterium]|nr:RdgB/HAM1 family non-canonical purine NTP pyrophosphatase [Terriglobales bacterium]